jgi:hypothetical protein
MCCWTAEQRCAVEQFNRDVTLNRSTDVMLNRYTGMCCWTVERRCAVDQLKRGVILNRWTEMYCWTVGQRCAVEQLERDVLLNSRLEICCWKAEQRWAVEDFNTDVLLNRSMEMRRQTVQQSCAIENCQVAHYRIRWPVISNIVFGTFRCCSVTNEIAHNYPWTRLTTNVAGQTPVLLLRIQKSHLRETNRCPRPH